MRLTKQDKILIGSVLESFIKMDNSLLNESITDNGLERLIEIKQTFSMEGLGVGVADLSNHKKELILEFRKNFKH